MSKLKIRTDRNSVHTYILYIVKLIICVAQFNLLTEATSYYTMLTEPVHKDIPLLDSINRSRLPGRQRFPLMLYVQ
jgi:hypothetical protein